MFWGVSMMQETGWIMLGIACSAYSWSQSYDRPGVKSALLSAFVLQLAIQAREYGTVFILASILIGFYYGAKLKVLLVHLLACLLLAAPWYSWVAWKMGNPVYPLSPLDLLPVNPFLHEVFQESHSRLSLIHLSLKDIISLVWFMFQGVAPCLLAFLICLRYQLRPMLPLLAVSLLFVFLWLHALAFTSGGHVYAARVGFPLMLVAALAIQDLPPHLLSRFIVTPSGKILSLLAACISVAWAFNAPLTPRTLGWQAWFHESSTPKPVGSLHPEAVRAAPKHFIISDDAYAHAKSLYQPGTYRLIPPWTPELLFLSSNELSTAKASEHLRILGVQNTGELKRSPLAEVWEKYPLLESTITPFSRSMP
ncbi:MAG: hypothetical protein HC904_12830 [Blastochloris sp.]|nr:hypothetical protein [Blastochloris sp.]